MSKQTSISARVGPWLRYVAMVGAVVAATALFGMFDLPDPLAALLAVLVVSAVDHFWPARAGAPPAVVVTDDAIRIGDRTIAWHEINALSAGGEGLELRNGQITIATVDGRVENYEQIVRAVLQKVTVDPVWMGKPRTVSADVAPMCMPLLGVAAVLWLAPANVWVWLGCAIISATTIARLSKVRRLELGDEGVRIRSFLFRRQFIPRETLRSIALKVQANGAVQTVATVRGDDVVLSAGWLDPFEVFVKARRAYPDLA